MVRSNAISSLIKPLLNDPDVLGTNGILAIDQPPINQTQIFPLTPRSISVSGTWQAVNTTFTAICALRRSALRRWEDGMNGANQGMPMTSTQGGSSPPVFNACARSPSRSPETGLILRPVKTPFQHRISFCKVIERQCVICGKRPNEDHITLPVPNQYSHRLWIVVGVYLSLHGCHCLGSALSTMLNSCYLHCETEMSCALLSTPFGLAEGMAYALGVIQGGRHRFRA